MKQIVKKRLPHGKIPFVQIRDQVVRDIVMRLNENILVLQKSIEELQEAVMELQRKRG